MKHRIISLLLAALLIVSLLPFAALAADAGKVRVIVENTVLRESNITVSGNPVQIWYDQLFDVEVPYRANMTADSAMKAAFSQLGLDNLPQYEDGQLIGIGTLKNYGTGAWMTAVNDWITTAGEKVQPGDTVRIQYTRSRGKDIGADPASVDRGLSALTFDGGALYPSFSRDVTDYTLYVPAALAAVTIAPTAAKRQNKVFVTAGAEDASRWGARAVSVSCGTATVKVDGGKAYTVKLVPVAEPTPEPTPTTAPTPTPTVSPAPTPCDGGADCPSRIFTDVNRGAKSWYHRAVDWAVTNDVTKGISATAFGPGSSCSRGQMVTFLWRAAGKDAPSQTSVPFVDVPAGKFYTEAVLWALEKKLTTGTDKTHFSPEQVVTRGQTVTFLWRLEGKPEPKGSGGFSDVSASSYCAKAVAWAVENGITNGVGDGKFAPDADCSRAQIVTFLWRDLTGGETASALAAAEPVDDALAVTLRTVTAPKCGQDDLAVFDAARNAAATGRTLPDAYYAYLADAEAAARATDGRLGAENAEALAKTVLAVTAMGRSAADFAGYDLTDRLNQKRFVNASGTDGAIWALLALDSGSYVSYCRPDYVQTILSAQLEDGSIEGSTVRTAMALQALTPYLAEPDVLRAVNSALQYLSAQQQPNGGFAEADPAVTAQAVIMAETLKTQSINTITARVVDGFFGKENGTLQTHLLTLRAEDGSFGENHELALRALIAEQCSTLGVRLFAVR